MARYSNRDIFELFVIFGEANRIVNRTCQIFNARYHHLEPMTKTKFNRIQRTFIRTGQPYVQKRNKQKPVTEIEENEVNVLAYFHATPQNSISSASNDLGISYSSIQRILKKHKMHNYSFTPVQELFPDDLERRIQFCRTISNKIEEEPEFLNKIIWTDEAKFNREGIFNRRNTHHWALENPYVVRPHSFQVKFSVNVFCLLMQDRFYYHIYEQNLNSERYLEILQTIVEDFLNNLPLNEFVNCWYQLDRAPVHSSNEVQQTLYQMFGDRWIGRFGPIRWPARSPDLTPLDYYLWGNIKSKVYSTPVTSREDLLERIRTAFDNLNHNEILRSTTIEFNSRIIQCLNENGEHIENHR